MTSKAAVNFRHGSLISGSPYHQRLLADHALNASKLHPRPIYIPLPGEENGTIKRPILSGHSAEQLKQALIEYVGHRGSSISTAQRDAAHQFETINIGVDHNPYQKLDNDRILQTYCKLFDEVFFYGSLNDLVHVKFSHPSIMDTDFGRAATRHLPSRVTIPDNFAVLIEIRDLSRDNNGVFRNTKRNLYLGILLHEMLHAYFAIFLCQCTPKCRASFTSAKGSSGHGKLWLEAALALERATLPLLGMSLDIGREAGAMSEHGADFLTVAPTASTFRQPPMGMTEFGRRTVHWDKDLELRNTTAKYELR